MQGRLSELKERLRLNESAGVCVEHASCDPLPQTIDDYHASLGAGGEEIRLGKWACLPAATERNERAPPGGRAWRWRRERGVPGRPGARKRRGFFT